MMNSFPHNAILQELRSPEGVRVLLLGSAHISRASVIEVEELIKAIRPGEIGPRLSIFDDEYGVKRQ